jgi:protease-4
MPPTGTTLIRVLVSTTVAVVGATLAYVLFVAYPDGSLTVLLGVLLAVVVTLFFLRAGTRMAAAIAPAYDVAEVPVQGPISRDGGGPLPTQPGGVPAETVVDQIERADAGDGADALLLRLNTPGGEVVPSEEIRAAAESFDGPTLAYATDRCASGGYWIATGCDEFWAREATVVGSIGVLMSVVGAHELAERVGLSYEGITAGEYKDVGSPLKELNDDDRAYLQGMTDGFYEQFVERVADGRDVEPALVRETEARVYLGEEAAELGLVDEVGDREAIEDVLADRLDREAVVVEEFQPVRGLPDRLRAGARSLAYAFGAGVASVVDADGDLSLRFR